MKQKKNLLLALLLASGFLSLQAQTSHNHPPGAPLPCRAHQSMQEYYEAHPEALELEQANHARQKDKKGERPDHYIIPVVFHIFGENFSGKRVTDALVIDALRKTNEDFRGITANWGDDDPEFDRRKKEMNITFKLAEKAPNGATTTGIIYHQSESGFGWYNAPELPYYAWNNRHYMNIYIMNDLYGDGELTNSGVSWYPDEQMATNNLARVVYNGAYLGTNTDENFRRVLTHEFGHFFNLAHTFDYDERYFTNGCNDAGGRVNPGDHVDDTPAADRMLMGKDDLNCKGEKTNWTNFMNYSYIRTSMYTAGQVERMIDALDHSSRITLWSAETHEKVFFNNPDQKRIALIGRPDILEASANDGSFTSTWKYELTSGMLANKEYVYGTDYTMQNLPEGLSPRLVRTSDTKLTLHLDGKALKHDARDEVSDLSIRFADSMLSEAGSLYICDLELSLQFRNSYKVNYSGIQNININTVSYWKFIQLSDKYVDSEFGVMYDANTGNLLIETYSKPIIGTGRAQNLQWLDAGETIGDASGWTNCGTYPALATLYSSSFTYWKGKVGFVGFQFNGIGNDEIHYGWMRISVSEDGTSYTLIDYAFNEAPGVDIIAGQKDENPISSEVVFSTATLNEDADLNNGSIADKLTIYIMGDNTFSKTGVLVPDVDYIINKIPAGLTTEIKVLTEKTAVLILNGRAEVHESRYSMDCRLELKSPLFSKTDISIPMGNFRVEFINEYKIKKGNGGWGAGTGAQWTFIRIDGLEEAEYGAWEFATNHLKLETYRKPMVCMPGTSNIAPLASGTMIGPDANWKTSNGEYGDQPDIYSSYFTDWKGKTAYAGFTITVAGSKRYGWMKITVNESGSYFTIEEWAYNEFPGQPIVAGDTEVVNVGEITLFEDVSVYPNPVNDQLNIMAPEATQLRVYSIAGTLLRTQTTTTGNTTLSVSDWAKGIYFIHLKRGNASVVKKVIVN